MVRVKFEHNYTFDTCTGIKICENPNVGTLLSCRINFENSTIHLNSQTVIEANRLGYDINSISKQIKESIGAKVIFGSITHLMIQDAKYLDTKCPTLHNGDDYILAYARATNTTLVTCDKGLAEAATLSGTKVVNPDLLPCEKMGLRKSKLEKIVDKAIRKPSVIKQKVKLLILKPGQKIVWRSFQ
jgi:predicted nuclease of predicted toxin-antitoxin system